MATPERSAHACCCAGGVEGPIHYLYSRPWPVSRPWKAFKGAAAPPANSLNTRKQTATRLRRIAGGSGICGKALFPGSPSRKEGTHPADGVPGLMDGEDDDHEGGQEAPGNANEHPESKITFAKDASRYRKHGPNEYRQDAESEAPILNPALGSVQELRRVILLV